MKNPFKSLKEEYDLNNFQTDLHLSGEEKIDFCRKIDDIERKLWKNLCYVDLKLSPDELEIIMVIIKLSKNPDEKPVIKKHVRHVLKSIRTDEYVKEFNDLEKKGVIKKTELGNSHILKFAKDYPDYEILEDFQERYWNPPKTQCDCDICKFLKI